MVNVEMEQLRLIYPKLPNPKGEAQMAAAHGPSSTHCWLIAEGRKLELEPGKPLLHRFCTACQRNFVHDLTTGEWYAAIPRMFDFERLHMLSEHWLNEPCPGKLSESAAG
jgi:hypothetical protein